MKTIAEIAYEYCISNDINYFDIGNPDVCYDIYDIWFNQSGRSKKISSSISMKQNTLSKMYAVINSCSYTKSGKKLFNLVRCDYPGIAYNVRRLYLKKK